MTQKFLIFIVSLVFACTILLNFPDKAFAHGYKKTPQFGGDGGDIFADNLTRTEQIVSIDIWVGKPSAWYKVFGKKRIVAIQTTWSTPEGTSLTGCKRGKDTGEKNNIQFRDGEYITKVNGRTGDEVDSLTFTTNMGQKFGPYGGDGGKRDFEEKDLHVGGFFGRSGNRIDAIGFWNLVED